MTTCRLCAREARVPQAPSARHVFESTNKRRGLELVRDSTDNRRRGAQAPVSAFAKGEGMTLAGVAQELLE